MGSAACCCHYMIYLSVLRKFNNFNGFIMYLLSSKVVFTTAGLKGPGPITVYALTVKVYSTNSSKFCSNSFNTGPSVRIVLFPAMLEKVDCE